jgi:hypothetical protein
VTPWSGINCDQNKPIGVDKDPRHADPAAPVGNDKDKDARDAYEGYANFPYQHAPPVQSSDPLHPDVVNNPVQSKPDLVQKPVNEWFDTYPHNAENYEKKPGLVTYMPYNQYGQNNYKYPLYPYGYKPGYQNAQMNSLDYLVNANKPYDPLSPFVPPPYPNQQYPGQQIGMSPNRYPNGPNQPYVTPYFNRYPNQGGFIGGAGGMYGSGSNGCTSSPCQNEGVGSISE